MPQVLIDGNLVEVPISSLFADDGLTPFSVPTNTTNNTTGQTFTADDIARVRQEEKDKLYSRLDTNNQELTALRDQVGSLTAAEQRRAAQLEQEQQALLAQDRAKEEEELDAKSLLARREQEWETRLNTMEQSWTQKYEGVEQQRLAAEAMATKEREFANLGNYAQQQVEANSDKIAPQLRSWISGNTQEEIDSAIARAISTTDEIAAELQQSVPSQVVPVTTQAPALPGTRAVGGPANTDPAAHYQQLTPEQIANMPMDQYAKLRGQIGIGAQGNNRGLFG